MNKLSVMIITYNEEKHIDSCLESVSWADEIIVVDACSEDKTVEICKKHAAKIYINAWPGFSRQKSFALGKCSHSWVMNIDADERVRPELKAEIQGILQNPAFDGYKIARRSYFLGKWIKHCGWYPGYQVRLFKKEKTRLSDRRVHEGFIVQGTTSTLKNDLDHFSHPDIYTSIEKLNIYTTLEAFDRLDRKPVHVHDFMTHFISSFWNKFIAHKGFLDGVHGFLLSWISAFLKMVLYMKIWHFQQMSPKELQVYKEQIDS
ncbi:glycosyltransferase [candidate division KSB1 bacterium]|nr:glycosyltransferase [candidate division KSB1 bacterium]